MPEVTINSLKALVIFKTLYEVGSASGTARLLDMTQSGVSRSLAQLEENLGLQLFLREKNRLLATPEAQELYDEILRLMGNIEELRHSVLALKEFGTSRLRIAAIPGLCFGFVPQVVAALLTENSRVSISLDMMSSYDVQSAVESSHADIGFITLPATSPQLFTETLLVTEAVALVPEKLALAKYDVIEISDLLHQHLIISNQPSISTNPLLEMVAEHGIKISGKTEANIGTITALVANGVGVTVINPITAKDQLSRHDRVKLLPFMPVLSYGFGIVYRPEWHESKVLASLKQKAKELLMNY
ncbi:LysR family transcriptional regulator [Vreelandella boliviensis]|uniref:LysR family transcriptional regulator n=1 Tax=Vreelandella boliviensis LC1 TaxID=1072583 RepID=A0A265DZG8_9GAMM|nr:LysR family transcriptional regulator [Halomonas boliviensis]EHJ93963.1 Regulatory protein nocR [Halomonas boliviensis LC1]OZT74616.1 LysR family transcriptional regulator [Halomonas boliviensis LC1]